MRTCRLKEQVMSTFEIEERMRTCRLKQQVMSTFEIEERDAYM